MNKALIANVFLISALLAATALGAEVLPDPTRPPALIMAPDEAKVAVPASPVLQSVLISPLRRVATINGQIVKVGDKIGDAKVVKIAESEVVLRKGKDVEVLKLFPNIEKRSMAIPAQGVQKRTEATKVR
jgi:MSHA biogenesis protein MshK